MGSGTDGEDDPFARIAAVLRDDQPTPPNQKRLVRKSRPSFSELAPIIPPGTIPTPPASDVSPSKPPPPIPYMPSVIIAEDEPPPPPPRVLEPTVRGRRARTLRKRHAMSPSLVILVLVLSLIVFGLGMAAFLATRPAAPPAAAPSSMPLPTSTPTFGAR